MNRWLCSATAAAGLGAALLIWPVTASAAPGSDSTAATADHPYDPLDPSDPDSMCVHGNPNVLTDDVGTSSLARGCTGAAVLVQVEKFDGPLPPVRAHQPPVIW